jgi:hypothetical protein
MAVTDSASVREAASHFEADQRFLSGSGGEFFTKALLADRINRIASKFNNPLHRAEEMRA